MSTWLKKINVEEEKCKIIIKKNTQKKKKKPRRRVHQYESLNLP